MKNEHVDGISKALGISYDRKEQESSIVKKIETPLLSPEKLEKDLSRDYGSVRSNMKDLIIQGQDAIEGILNVANDTDSPRAYEVAAQMIKAVSEMNKDLLDMHNKVKTIRQENVTVNNNTTNAVYVGSTSELQDLINASRSSKKAFVDQEEKDDE
jgi:hypothetical protein